MPVTPNDLTRQQLDELDALLQRMLSVPVGQSPEPAPVMKLPEIPLPESVVESARITRADMPTVTPRQPHLVADEAPPTLPEFPMVNRLFGPPTPDTGVPASTESLFPQTSRFEPVAVPAFSNEDDSEVPLGPEPVALTAAPTEPAMATPPATVPVAHWPLFGVNWILENTLKLFGPVGDVACSGAGKFVLGWGGVALLAAAGLWSAKGMGWVQFPWPPKL
jgi:hypothetical protein